MSANEQPSVRDLEADLARTRERLAGSVDQLAAKLDVKTQATEKIDATKAQAAEKVAELRQQVVETSRSLVTRFRTASRPVQVSVAATPVVALLVLIVRKARG